MYGTVVFLLESVVGGEKIARYSFIATRPAAVYQATSNDAVTTRDGRRIDSGPIRHARGHAQLPLSDGELDAKFLD